MMVNIKVAEQNDYDQLVLMVEALHRESPSYSKLPFNAEVLLEKIAFFDAQENNILLIAEDEQGCSIGYFMGGLFENFFNREVIAFDYSVYVMPDKRNGRAAIKLIRAFEEWAKEKGASSFQIGITTNINVKRTTKFYQLLGFSAYGVSFEKRL